MKGFSCQYILIFCVIISIRCNETASNKKNDEVSAQIKDTAWALVPFVKIDSENPILGPANGTFICPIRKQKVLWEEKDVFNPAIAVRGDTLFMLYRAQDKMGKPDGTSRIGLAESTDGIHFISHPEPVLYPANDEQKKYEWEGGCEDPRIVQDESGNYYMTYTAYDGKMARLMVASSKDLKKWTKHGPAFAAAYHGKYIDEWSKSGSIISRYDSGKIVATKINGKYWMYWGDQSIWLATSDDLIKWTPLEKSPSEHQPSSSQTNAQHKPDLRVIIAPRKNKFDNDLVESGPPAMLTDQGVLLIYNSRTMSKEGDSSLPKGTYVAGQVLLDKNDPTRIIHRTDSYFMKPDKPYEITGQVNNVCFLEGLARFKNKWLLYYGTADSKIAVASRP